MAGGKSGDTHSDLAALILARRCELHKSQRDVVDELRTIRPTFDRSEWRNWEKGKVVPGRFWLPHVAAVLELEIGVLRAAKSLPRQRSAGRIEPAETVEENPVLDRRDLLLGTAGLSVEAAMFRPTGITEAPEKLRTQLAKAQNDFRLGKHAALGKRLPGLMDRAVSGSDKRLTTDMWTLATEYLIKTGQDDLALLASDRAATAAAESGDRLAQAEAEYCRCMTLRHSGRSRTAYTITADAASKLADGGLRTSDDFATYGHLFLTAGYSAASAGDAGRAEDYMREAESIAARFPSDVAHGMWFFGPAQAGLYRLSMENALGNVGGGVNAARALDPVRLPTPERRARYWIDVARLYGQWTGHQVDVAAAVRRAYAEAPGEVTSRPKVLELARNAGLST
ncbi:hypothetical protein ABH920_001909 [Catenulispora sp. EB89]|uniref:hypothetical protein n=1 Tax=Catenulispora sp. EB89 TaxID=3156257 RepID=UPI003519954B